MLSIFRSETGVQTAPLRSSVALSSPTASLTSLAVLILAGVFSSSIAIAQEIGQPSIKVGEADLYPSVRLDVVSNDNVLRSSQSEVDASGLRIAPSALLVANKRGLELKTGYEGAYASFSEDELNYDDHRIFGAADAIFGTRKRAAAEVNLSFRHEALGTGITAGRAVAGDEQVEILDFSTSGSFTYGAPSARINATAGLDLTNTAYQNRSDLTNGRDYLAITPYGQLSYRLSADTRALIELRLGSLSFDNDQLDRTELQLLTGLSFRGTGKSGGQGKIGVTTANYSDSRIQNRNTLVADIGLYFLPTTFSRIDVGFTRRFNNEDLIDITSADASQTIDDTASVSWRNQWSGFVKSTAALQFSNQNRDCPEAGSQSIKGGIDISILPRRWIEFGVGVSSTSFTVDDCGLVTSTIQVRNEYDLLELTLFTKISL